MPTMLRFLAILAFAMPAIAGPARDHVAPPPPDPEVIRQGGDTIADAVVVSLPYSGSGATVGYTDDYDEACPYSGSTSPDVVYTFVFPGNQACIDVDLCGSSYDTKAYVYDQNLALVACNDDFYFDDHCGWYVSKIEALNVPAGTYHVVVDGYGGESGEYLIEIYAWGTPWIICPPGAVDEGEPTLEDGYVDAHNGGCDAVDDVGQAVLQPLSGPLFCGRSGWYHRDGEPRRDSDWFMVTLPPTSELEVTAESNLPLSYAQMGPLDCGQVGVLQEMVLSTLEAGTLTLTGAPGAEAWLRVRPTDPEGHGEDVYVLSLPEVVATAPASWSRIKGLYR